MCRRERLDRTRRCGFLPEDQRGPRTVVWARGRTSTEECPKSLITADSVAHLEEFHLWKLAGGAVREMPAKRVEAFVILEKELAQEMNDGQINSRQAL